MARLRVMTEKSVPKLDWKVVFNRMSPPGARGWGRVRAAQLHEMSKAMEVAAWGQTFNALLIVWMMAGRAPPLHVALWLLSIAMLMHHVSRHRARLGRRQVHSIPRKTLNRAAYHSVFLGFVWGFPARHFFEYASHGQQLGICVITATMMAGAAFIFAPAAAAAAPYVLIMGVAMTRMLMSTDSLLITAIGPIYTGALLIMVLINGRSFIQRKCLDIALEERQETVSLLLREYESSDADWLWQTNAALGFQNVSVRFARALGRSVDELENESFLDLLRSIPRGDQTLRRALASAEIAISRREAITELVIPVQIGDETRNIEVSARPAYSRHGRFIGYRGVGSDVTQAREAADRIAHMARHDALTGLPNRLYLMENLEAAIGKARNEGHGCAVLLVDLDRFKTINDSLGHVAGDHLLREVSRCFETVISDDMTAGRLGGDEFAIVVPTVTSRDELEQLCLALLSSLNGPFHYRDQRLFVGACIGVAVGPGDGESVEELIRSADLALYRAKNGEGNNISFFDPDLHARAEERRRIELALHGAVDKGELSLNFQPVVDAETLRIRGFEALLRWNNPELGNIGPDKFIPIAEETGLLGRIGEWVLRTACREAVGWPDDVALAVNVSPKQLRDPGFTVTLMSALSQAGLAAHRLELEVTETVFLELTDETQKVLEQIQSLGVRLAMDDFGTGYSSLGYLRQAKFDTLKIDRSFVQSMTAEDGESTAIVRAVVALAGSLGMTTVAEGVQSEEQLDLVRALGCDRIQGYIFSRPVSGSTVRTMLGEAGSRAAA